MDTITGLLILSIITQSSCQGMYDVQKVDASPGIYYEKLGTVRIKRVDWKVNVALEIEKLLSNMKPVASYQAILNDCITKLSEAQCIWALGVDTLDAYVKKIHTLQQAIREGVESIGQFDDISIRSPRSLRKKRFVPLGIIGSLSSSLFGLVTEEEVTNINQNIDKLFQDQKSLVKLEDQKAHIITTNFDELYNVTKSHEKKINDLEKLLIGRVNQVRKEEEELKFMLELNSYVRCMEAKLLHLVESCQELLDIVFALRDGKVHTKLLNSDSLHKIIQDINKLNFDVDFPVPSRHIRLEEIQRIAQVDAVKMGERIIIVLHLPLVERVPYTLYKLHSLAVHQIHNNKSIGLAYVQPSHDYLLLRADQNQYAKWSYEVLNDCIRTHYAYICPGREPLRSTGDSNECEINMLLKPSLDSLKLCDIILHQRNISQWEYLLSDGTWIFSIIDKESIRISCVGKPEETILLQGTGILRLANGCIGRTKDAVIMHEDTREDGQQYVYKPEINLNIGEVYPILLNHIDIDHADPLHNTDLNRWSNDKQKLSNVVQRMTDIGNHKREILHTNYTVYGGFLVQMLLILGAVILIKYSKLLTPCIIKTKQKSRFNSTATFSKGVVIEELPVSVVAHQAKVLKTNKSLRGVHCDAETE